MPSTTHARNRQLRVVDGESAGHGRSTPQRARNGQNLRPARPVGNPSNRNRDEAVEHCEVEAAEKTKLAVADVQRVLDGLGENRDQLPIEEIQHVDEAQHAEHNPCAQCGGSCRRRKRWRFGAERSQARIVADARGNLSHLGFPLRRHRGHHIFPAHWGGFARPSTR